MLARGKFEGRVIVAVLLFALSGCVSAERLILPLPSPADIPDLEAEVERSPDDTELLVRLGAAYREAGALGQARSILERARDQDPGDPRAAIFLGLAYEDLQMFPQARALYEGYLANPANTVLRDRLEERIPLLRRQEIQLAVANALVAEPPEIQENSVAVMPFLYRAPDPEYSPLSRAVAAMMVTDLSQTNRLSVLERMHVQLLVDEIALGATSLADPATAARSGRLLGTANVVQGLIDGDPDLLRLEAAVVDARDAASGQSVSEEDAVDLLFDMEKRLVFRVFSSLGIELTPAERDRINRRPTANVRALIEYGRGLEELDAGNYAAAAAHFRRAAEIDPEFEEAERELDSVIALDRASLTSTQSLAEIGAPDLLPPLEIEDLSVVIEMLDELGEIVPIVDGRDPASEVTETEGLGARGAILEIVIRRPGGGQ